MHNHIYNKLSKYDVISFDIFDTILKRNVLLPEDIFVIVQNRYNNTHTKKIINFCEQREIAYKKAKEKKNIFEISYIYEFLEFDKHICNELMQLEINTEIGFAIGNKRIIEILKYLKKEGKHILIISDMYLPLDTVLLMLTNAGVNKDDYDSIYLSCECGAEKNKGELYRRIYKEKCIKKGQWIHIGDNWKSDVMSAFLSGVDSYHIATEQNNLQYGNPYKQFPKTIQNSILLATANNLVNHASSEFERIGIETMGPFMLGYILWLHNHFIEDGIEKVFFLARDGKIMMRYHDIFFSEEKYEVSYMYASRRSIIIPTYWVDCTFDKICLSMSQPKHMSIQSFFYRVNVDISLHTDILKRHGIDENYTFNGSQMLENNTLRSIFEDIKEDIYKNSYKEYVNLEEYLKQIGFTGKKVAIVDVGWNGGMQKALENMPYIQEQEIELHGYYLGINSELLNVELKNAHGYIYEKAKNAKYRYYIYGFAGPLEMTFFSNHGTTLRFRKNSEGSILPVLDNNEYVVNGKKTKELVGAEEIQYGVIKYLNLINNLIDWNFEEVEPLDAFCFFFNFATSPKRKHLNLFRNYGAVDLNSKQVFIGQNYCKLYGEYSIWKGFRISTWKIGFMKFICRIPLPYKEIYLQLRKRR